MSSVPRVEHVIWSFRKHLPLDHWVRFSWITSTRNTVRRLFIWFRWWLFLFGHNWTPIVNTSNWNFRKSFRNLLPMYVSLICSFTCHRLTSWTFTTKLFYAPPPKKTAIQYCLIFQFHPNLFQFMTNTNLLKTMFITLINILYVSQLAWGFIFPVGNKSSNNYRII